MMVILLATHVASLNTDVDFWLDSTHFVYNFYILSCWYFEVFFQYLSSAGKTQEVATDYNNNRI